MGQYYRALTIDRQDNPEVLSSYEYGSGCKLMEHSYIGNRFVDAVLRRIYENPMRVAWMGDYATDEDGSEFEKKVSKEELKKWYDTCWKKQFPDEEKIDKGSILGDACRGYYLVNHDTQEYIDLEEYFSMNCWLEKYQGYVNGDNESEYKKHVHYLMCVNPLPLLTACGNGRGGGDYHKCFPDCDLCGTWAFDRIELVKQKPRGFKAILPRFTEEKRVDAA